jgi:hypothetical protein
MSGRVSTQFTVKWLFLLFLLSPACLHGDWKVLDRRDWPVSDGKLTASELRVADGADEAEVNLVYFTAADVTLEVIANTDGQIRGLRELVETRGGLAGGFGICRSVTLEEIGDVLAQTRIVPDHHIVRALNFDGGSSTTFYVRTDGRTIFSEGRPVVSSYLVVKAK